MKKAILTILILSIARLFAQDIAFEKDNFPGQKDQFKEARKNFEQGAELFTVARKDYDAQLEYYIQDYKYLPVSRKDYLKIGEDQFLQSLQFLEKAYAFNPNYSVLNYMIGFAKFHTNHQKEDCIKYLEKAAELNPKVAPDVYYILGWAYQLHYKWDKAIASYEKYSSTLQPKEKRFTEKMEDIEKKISECNNGKKYMSNPQRMFIDNLGSTINSPFPDYSAFITADESMIIFTSRRDNTTGGKKDEMDGGWHEDLYVSYKKNGKWTSPLNMGSPINSPDHDATAGLSPDGTTLYIYEHHGKGGGDIYHSHLVGNTWSKPEKLNKNINSNERETTVSESFDKNTLYFVSHKKEGLGGGDVYISQKDAKGNWGPAMNFGAPVNTKYSEEGVFMHPDGKTLYFSSKGHNTMGGYDIFKSTFENGKWSAPENLGYPINSPDDDVYFVISGSGRRGYYASAKDEGFGEKDIYMITFLGPEKSFAYSNEDNLIASIAEPVKALDVAPPAEISSKALTLLKGTITDAVTQKPLTATIELVDNTKNEVIATFSSNSATGKYLVMLPSGKNYGIAVKSEGYLFHSENFDIPATTGFQELVKDIGLKNVAVGSKIILKNIFFDFDKASLRPESTNELERLIKLLNDIPSMKIEMGGHTDSKGSDEYNQKLSQARCESVVNYLVGKGISKERLVAKGYGESQPIATNDTDEGRQMNRRTEFTILSK